MSLVLLILKTLVSMNLSQQFNFVLTTDEVVLMKHFFPVGLSKMGNGEFRDAIERIYKRFQSELLKSEVADLQKQNSDIF